MAANSPIMVLCSESMRDAIDARCLELDIARTELIRRAIAAYLDLDISQETRAGRPKKYANKEEREAAQKRRAKVRRELTAKLVRAYEAGDHQDDIEALARSLANALKT